MTPKGRDRKDGPWLWVNKAQVNKILRECGSHAAGRMALTVYMILARIASDKVDAASFTLSQTAVAFEAGLTSRTIRDAIKSLCKCGALSYKVKSLGGIGTWTLLSPSTLTEKRPPERDFLPPQEQNGSLTVPTLKEKKEKKGNPSRIITEEEKKANLESSRNWKR